MAIATYACGGGGEKEPVEPPAPPELTGEQLAHAVDLRDAPLSVVLERLDRNDDGRIDRTDVEAFAACLGGPPEPSCDLDGDGERTTQELVLMRTLVGWQEPRSEAVQQLMSEGLLELAGGTGPPAGADLQVPLFDDYDGDGDVDRDDITLLGHQLADDPAARLDTDGDDMLGLSDVWAYAAALAGTYVNEPTEMDANGDGAIDEGDVALVSGLAALATKTYGGYLDMNFDGVVDEADYCELSNHAGIPNFYYPLLPEEDASVAFEADHPSVSLCRSDGKPLLRFPAHGDSSIEYVVRPQSLYLEEVSAVPTDYRADLSGPIPGGPLFVVTTQASGRPITELRVNWRLSLDGPPPMSLEIGGNDVPAGAILLLPDGYVSLEAGALLPTALSNVDRVAYNGMSPEERSQFDLYRADLNALGDAYRAKLAECDLLPPAEATEVLRFLYSYREALHQLQAHAGYRLTVLRAQHAQNLNAHVAGMSASAIRWNVMDDMIMEVAGFEVGMLMVEIAEGASKGGLPGALVTATQKLVEELAFKDDNLPVYLTGEGDIVTDMLGGLVSGEVLEQVGVYVDASTKEKVAAWAGDGTVVGELENIYGRLFADSDGFPNEWAIKDALGQVFKLISSAFEVPDGASETTSIELKSAVTGIATAILKNFPKMLVNFAIRQTLAADVGATANAQAFNVSARRVAAWTGAVGALAEAESEIDALITDYEGKYGDLVDPSVKSCTTDLNVGVATAEDIYAAAERTAREKMAALEVDLFYGEADFLSDCYEGDAAAAFEAVMLRQTAMANYVDIEALNVDSTRYYENLSGAVGALGDAVTDFVAGSNDEGTKACNERLDAFAIPAPAYASYKEQLDAVFDARGLLADARDEAWTNFAVCVGAGAGAFKPPFFDNSVWENARAPLEAAPRAFSCPIIRSLSPATAPPGSVIELQGEGLGTSSVWEAEFDFMLSAADGRERLAIIAPGTAAAGPPKIVVPTTAEPGEWDVIATRTVDGVTLVSKTGPQTKFIVGAAPSGGLIAIDDGDDGLLVIDPAVANPTPIVIATVDSFQERAAWSPDFSHLVFHGFEKDPVTIANDRNKLSIRLPDGSMVADVYAPAGETYYEPQFSPDGTQIMFSSSANAGEIWVMSASGTNLRPVITRINPDSYLQPGRPTWSRDGQLAAVLLDDWPDTLVGQRHVYVFDPSAENLAVTRVSSDTNTIRGSWFVEVPLMWPATGNLLFLDAYWGHYYSVNPDGTGLMSIFPSVDDQVSQENNAVALSPDGTRIAYRPDGFMQNPLEIWVMDADGTNRRKVVDAPSAAPNSYCLAWSPSGTEIAYVEGADAFAIDVKIVDVASGTSRVAYTSSFAECIYWSP